MKQDLYYIQNIGFEGNYLRWHKSGGHGYTSNLDEAWKVSREEAIKICANRPEEDFPRPAELMDKIAARCVNGQFVKKARQLPRTKLSTATIKDPA